tara:strand:- start:113 stop:856 length:744 start_codon:yes stop_codon:yes gene_type:complete
MLLKDKTAVITGCNKGIGKKITEIFSENGANIFACVRNIDENFKIFSNSLTKKFKNEIIPIQMDLGNDNNVIKAANEIISSNRSIDILVNNAATIHTALFQMTSAKKIREIFEVNFFSQTIFTQYILKPMIKNKKGSIIYIASTSAIDGNEGRSAYSASKAALVSQAKSLSRELGIYNIRVNSVSPGLTNTDMMNNNHQKKIIEDVVSRSSLKRVADPKEIANAVLMLSSDLSSFITGQNIRIDGGM